MSTNVLLQSMSSLTVGEIPKFVQLENRYKCVVCDGVLQVPLMSHCGHRMCRSCAEQHLARSEGRPAKCPGGLEDCFNITMEELLPDFGTHREIQRLEVYCSNNKHGCQQAVAWIKLKDHEAVCPYALEDCVNKGFGCTAKVSKIKRQEHLDKECKHCTKQCPHCDVRLPESILQDHIQDLCPAVSIICPYKCGEQSIERGKLEQHKTVCRAKPKDCTYKDVGCTYTGSPDEVNQHEAQSVVKHLGTMHQAMKQMKQENAQLKQKLEEQNNTATSSSSQDLMDVLPKIPVIERRQDFQETLIKNTQKSVASMNEKYQEKMQNFPLKTELEAVKDSIKSVEQRLDTVKQPAKGGNLSEDAKTQLVQMERTIGLSSLRLQEMDLRLQCVETASYNGVLIWKIRDFKRRKQEAVSGRTVSLYSQPFYTSRYGYKACARIYLNGDGMGKNTHMSLFFVILRGDFDALLPWPFRQKVTMTLIDQEGGKKNIVDSFRADPTSNSFKKPTTDMNIASGCPLFAAQSLVESSTYLKEDCIFLKIHVDTAELKDASFDIKSGTF